MSLQQKNGSKRKGSLLMLSQQQQSDKDGLSQLAQRTQGLD